MNTKPRKARRNCADTDAAIELIKGGMTPYAAAKQLKMHLTTVYRAWDRYKQQTGGKS
ncbi:MAG TPA: hypothetical protein VN368_02710 [Candidatus Methylomirabilis sp.]|nr:hypothetical protein [Candidatus Methylomirabilis sp.]